MTGLGFHLLEIKDVDHDALWIWLTDGEALQRIINKSLDVRNSKEIHLKHHHMASAHFKKRTTHLDILGKVSDLYQHAVKTCPSCISTKPRLDRSRVSD